MGNDLRALKAMTFVMNQPGIKSPIFKGVKMPYVRAKETKPRKEYDRSEDRLREKIVPILKKKGFWVKRVETMAHGFGDLFIMHRSGKLAAWLELKSLVGKQRDSQVEFEKLCLLNKIPYLIIRTEEEAENIFYLAGKLFA